MADRLAEGAAGSGGKRVDWKLHFEDATDTVTIEATCTEGMAKGGPTAPDPQVAELTVELNSSVSIAVDLLTGDMTPGGDFSQAAPGKILNQGVKVRTGVRLKLSADRAAAISFSTRFVP